MAIKILQQSSPRLSAIRVVDTGIGPGARTLGGAIERFGNILTDTGTRIGENKAIEQATEMANAVSLRDENGNLKPVTLPEHNGMIGPTVYQKQYQKQLLDNYRNAVIQDGSQYLNNLHSENRFDPQKYDAAAQSYIENVSNAAPAKWRAEIHDSLQQLRVQHVNRVALERSDRDFKEAAGRHGHLMEQASNEIAALFNNNKSWDSLEVQEKYGAYQELLFEGLENQYYGRVGANNFLLQDQEKFAKAMIAGKIMAEGDSYYAQDDRQRVINEFVNGDMELEFLTFDDNGRMQIIKRKSGTMFDEAKRVEMGRQLRSIEALHQNTMKLQTDSMVDALSSEFSDALNMVQMEMLYQEPGEYVDPRRIGRMMNDLVDVLRELNDGDYPRKERMLERIVDYATKRSYQTMQQLKNSNAWNEKFAQWEQVNGHLMIRINEVVKQFGPEFFKVATGEESHPDWAQELAFQNPHRLHNNISNTYRALAFKVREAGGTSRFDKIHLETMQWWDKATALINEFNRMNGIEEGVVSEAGIRFASQEIGMPNYGKFSDALASDYFDNLVTSKFYNITGEQLDWSNLNQDTDIQRQLVSQFSPFGVPPRGLVDMMAGAMRSENFDSPAMISRGLMWFQELEKNPIMFTHLAGDKMLGRKIFNAYRFLDNTGGNLGDVRIRERVEKILMDEDYTPFDQLDPEHKTEIRSAINEQMRKSTEFFDSDIRPPRDLYEMAIDNAAMRAVEYPDDMDIAAEMGFKDAMEAGGYVKTYIGYDHTVRGQKNPGENIYIYAAHAPEFYAQQGLVDPAYLQGGTWEQIKTDIDLDQNAPIFKHFNAWAKENLNTGPVRKTIELGKNAFLDHYQNDYRTGLPIYRVVLKTDNGDYMYATGNSRYDFTRNLPHPLFDFNEHYPKWYEENYERLEQEREDQTIINFLDATTGP